MGSRRQTSTENSRFIGARRTFEFTIPLLLAILIAASFWHCSTTRLYAADAAGRAHRSQIGPPALNLRFDTYSAIPFGTAMMTLLERVELAGTVAAPRSSAELAMFRLKP